MSALTLDTLKALMPHALLDSEQIAQALGLTLTLRGKVRDNYLTEAGRLMIVTDRISAFDHVLGAVPLKGALLSHITRFWFEKTAHVVPNHLLAVPDPQVLIVQQAQVFAVECVVRRYLTGSLRRAYLNNGGERVYALHFAPHLPDFHRFDAPILTPTTKAAQGAHDEPITPEQAVKSGLCSADEWAQMQAMALTLFEIGERYAESRGLILVDTKYEFGRNARGELMVVDEIHTPDSSRYWYASDAAARIAQGEAPRALDKEFLRHWLLARGFDGHSAPPTLTDDIKAQVALRYLELADCLIDVPFEAPLEAAQTRIVKHLKPFI